MQIIQAIKGENGLFSCTALQQNDNTNPFLVYSLLYRGNLVHSLILFVNGEDVRGNFQLNLMHQDMNGKY